VGAGGKAVTVVANYFRLKTPSNAVVYDYRVDFEPEVEARVVRKGLLFNDAVRQAFNDRLIFDGMSNLKSTVRLAAEETEFYATRTTDQSRVKIRVRRVGELGWGHQEMFRLYNTQMRRNMQLLKWNLIGRHYFNPQIRHTIPEHKLEVLQGLLTAINRHDGGILMVADTVHKIIRQDSVLDNLRDIFNRDRNGFTTNARRELSGAVVITKYNNKTYRVDDICFDKNPRTTFDKRGTPVSFMAYYKQQYNIDITDEGQPLLIALPSLRDQRAGQTTAILLVPELCNMTGISDSMADDFNIRRELTQRTQQDPNQRVQHLNQFIGSIHNHPQIRQDMAKWGLEFDTTPVEVPARVLDCERVLMHGQTPQTGTVWDQKAGDFSREIRGKPMFSAINVANWAVICSQRDNHIVKDFSKKLMYVCRPLGVGLSQPQVTVIDNDRTSAFVEASNAIPTSCQIIVVILPNNNKERYDAIKKIFCCEHPMASQLIVKQTLNNPQRLMSVCTKIGIQMACKLGAEPWVVDIPVCISPFAECFVVLRN
jgi:aubergine-like protein